MDRQDLGFVSRGPRSRGGALRSPRGEAARGKGSIWDTEPGMDRQGLGVVSRGPRVKGGALRRAEGVRIFNKMRIFAKNTHFFQRARAPHRTDRPRGPPGVQLRGTYPYIGTSYTQIDTPDRTESPDLSVPAIPYPPIRHHPKMHLPEVALSCRVACVAPFIQNKSRFPSFIFDHGKKSKKKTLRVLNPRAKSGT